MNFKRLITWLDDTKRKRDSPSITPLFGELLDYLNIPLLSETPISRSSLVDALAETRGIKNLWENSIRTPVYVVNMLNLVGFEQEEMQDYALAGLLHDLGKTLHPEVYNSWGDWDHKKNRIMIQHPLDSQRMILKLIPSNPTIANMALFHHYTSRGYPANLNLTPREVFGGTLIDIADVYDASFHRHPIKIKGKIRTPREILELFFGKTTLDYSDNKKCLRIPAMRLIEEMYKKSIFGEAIEGNPSIPEVPGRRYFATPDELV